MEKINNFDKLFPTNIPIIFLHAHPDDEVFLSAGLIENLSKIKRDCMIIFCAASIVKNIDLTIIRQKEALRACKLLGVESIFFLNYCEPQYAKYNAITFLKEKDCKICEHIIEVIKRTGVSTPFILISYDNNGGYGNADHIKLNKIGKLFKQKFSNEIYDYFEITINRDKINFWLSKVQKKYPKNQLPKLSYWSNNFGLTDNQINFYYELNKKQLENKRKAFKIHKSQMPPNEFPLTLNKKDFFTIFGSEYLAKF
jgi:LmbE family N-acetylglucosaminyl deacetylase